VHRLTALAAGFLAGTLVVTSAQAVSITNRDEREQKLTIIEKGKTRDETLKPNAVLEGACPSGCVLRLNDSENDEYELEGTETVSIEDGFLYYDGPDGDDAPTTGDGKAAGPKQ
jgi:hypothetical protein